MSLCRRNRNAAIPAAIPLTTRRMLTFVKRVEQPLRRRRDLSDSGFKCLLVRPGRLAETADLPDELESCRRNLRGGGRRVRTPKHFDAAAHGARQHYRT